ncbi:MAG: hypothetical protein QXO96_07605, partial [Sulfolobales archaeon]
MEEFEYFLWDDAAENKGKVILSNTTGYQSLVISESTKGLRDEWYYSTGYWDGRYPAIEYVVLVDSKDVSYFLKGYCLDSYLRPPLSGMSYSQPLDVIEDESHWSYWIRKVIEYADENSTRFTNQDVLDALWYISERSYHCKNFYNELLMEVGYPIDGPRKNPAKFKVKIVEPENGEVFLVSTTIKVRVDTDISNARVSFYGGKEKMIHLGDDSEYPYEIEWFLESEGEYRLAVFCIGIVDGKEETETSDAVIIRVVDSGANLVLAKHSPLEAIHIDDDQYFCSTHTYRMPADVYEDTPVDIIIQVSTATPISSARLYYTQDATIPTLTSSYIKFTSFTATQDYIYYKATLPPQQANTQINYFIKLTPKDKTYSTTYIYSSTKTKEISQAEELVYKDSCGDSQGSFDIGEIYITDDADYIYFLLHNYNEVLTNTSVNLEIFIDVDDNCLTGDPAKEGADMRLKLTNISNNPYRWGNRIEFAQYWRAEWTSWQQPGFWKDEGAHPQD